MTDEMTPAQKRAANARKVQHLNALRRKADEYAAGLRELGYTVIAPKCNQHYQSDSAGVVLACVLSVGHPGSHSWLTADDEPRCPLCGGVNGHASICDEYGRES